MNADRPNAAKAGRDLAVAKLLAAGLSRSEAGAKLNISERTMRRIVAGAGFGDLVEAERRVQVGSVVEELADAAPAAVRILKALMVNSATTPALRARVCGMLLDQFAKHMVPTRVEMSGSLGLERIAAMSPEEVDAELAGLAQEIAKQRGDPDEYSERPGPPVRDSAPLDRVEAPEPIPAAETVTAPQDDANGAGDSGDQLPESEPSEDDPGNVVPMPPRSWQPDARLTQNPWRTPDPFGSVFPP